MKAVQLSKERINDFIDYCIKHRGDVDDSFLYDEDFEKLQLDEDNPYKVGAWYGKSDGME